MNLLNKLEGELRNKEPLCLHTSFGVGGKADMLFFPKNEASLISAVRIAKENDIPVFVLGNGSNLLVRDGGIDGLVLSLKKMGGKIELKETGGNSSIVSSPAWISMPKLARYTVDRGLGGIETLIGVPGSLGGALKMNAGAEGGEIGEVLHSVKMLNMQGDIREVGKNEITFCYRKTKFPEKGVFINVALELKKKDKDDLSLKMNSLLVKRNSEQPVDQRGAGSIFKNPEGYSAGRLIESAGLKGRVIGNAEVSTKHANFIINKNNATAKDIEDLIKLIQEKVNEKTGVSLEPEIEIAGKPG